MSPSQLQITNTQLCIIPDSFSAMECNAIGAAIEQSSAQNALSGAFDGTYGFQRVLRRDGIAALTAEFPCLAGFMSAAVRDERCDAFYINGLIIHGGRQVRRHLDCSLNGWLGTTRTAEQVVVLYVRVPDDLAGGELQLFDDRGRIAEIAPRTGTMLRFRGDLAHRVAPVRSGSARISVVLEQYAVGAAALPRIPRYSCDPDGGAARSTVAAELSVKLAAFAHGLGADERAAFDALVGTERGPKPRPPA